MVIPRRWYLWIACTVIAGWLVGSGIAHYFGPTHHTMWHTVQHIRLMGHWWDPLSYWPTVWYWMSCFAGLGWPCFW